MARATGTSGRPKRARSWESIGRRPRTPASRLVHELAIDDPSGVRLRSWLGMSDDEFYDPDRLAIVPMDFYYPGKAASGDAPPRAGFAAQWHPRAFELLPSVRLTVLVGAYAQRRYLPSRPALSLTETVRAAGTRLPYFPIVHPSPLTQGWRLRNPWFETDTVPLLTRLVREALEGS